MSVRASAQANICAGLSGSSLSYGGTIFIPYVAKNMLNDVVRLCEDEICRRKGFCRSLTKR